MCLNPYHMRYQTFDGSWRETDVPCGKCPECVRRAQSDLMILVHRQLEASTGSCWFVTLSYKDEKLPLALTFSVYRDLRSHDFASLVDPLETFDYRKHGELLRRSRPVRLARTPLKTHNLFFDSIASNLENWKPTRSSLAAREAAVLAEYSHRYRWNGFDGRLNSCVKPGAVMEVSRRWFTNKDGEPIIIIGTVTTSVDRQDPQLWLKNCRVAYERKFGCKLPEKMSYTMIQEYGPRGHRPHYHIIFTNIEQADLVWCLGRWARAYCGDPVPRIKHGSGVVYDRINRVTSTGANGFACAGKYLGAYFKKTEDVQEPTMLAGLSVRPRRCSSKFFGVGKDFDALRAHILGFDIFGEYDPCSLPSDDAEQILEVVQRRLHISLPLASNKVVDLAIPNYLRNKILKNVKVKVSTRKKVVPFTSSSFDSFCEGSGFVHKPYKLEPLVVSYPVASELSQGLADIEAFRSDIAYKEELYAFAGLAYNPLDLPADFSVEILDAFANYRDCSKREKAACVRSSLLDKYKKSKF